MSECHAKKENPVVKINFRCKNAVLASLAGALLLAASPVSALEPIRQEAHINNSLRAALVADQIRKTCPTIEIGRAHV